MSYKQTHCQRSHIHPNVNGIMLLPNIQHKVDFYTATRFHNSKSRKRGECENPIEFLLYEYFISYMFIFR